MRVDRFKYNDSPISRVRYLVSLVPKKPSSQPQSSNLASQINNTTAMGIQNKLADGIDEVDVIIAGGTHHMILIYYLGKRVQLY